MKILLFNWQCIRNPLGGGAEVHMHEIFKRIVAMGNQVTLYCCTHPELPNDENIDGIQIHRRGKREWFNFLVPKIYRDVIDDGYDIVVDDINKIPFYTPLFVKKHPILAISHHFFGKSILRQAGLIGGSYVLAAEKLVDWVYKSTHFAVVSQSTLDEFISRGFDPNKFTIIHNAYDKDKFSIPHNRTHPDKFRIAYFGRLKKYKSVDHLFLAFAEFQKKHPNSQLEIIGRGDFDSYLKSLAKKLGIEEKTIFYGYVSDEEKVRILSEVDLVVNTSAKEGWGITNIEANACGTPVVSADVPGLRDSVSDGKSGLLYRYGDIKDLTSKIEKALINTELNNKLQKGAIEWASSFSWDSSALKMQSLLVSLVIQFNNNK